jgi:histidinol-phosphate aminotransferase|tara:strand:- start:7669 stop:8715 length:1047 start_codon:yes stop_codon:yes gene_type:complete
MISDHLKKIKRNSTSGLERSNYLRLDANERNLPFEKKILEKFKDEVSNFTVQAYPKNKNIIINLLSKKEKLPKECISYFSGIDNNLKYIFEILSNKEIYIGSIYPTYGMIDIYSKIYRLKIKKLTENKILENIDKVIRLKKLAFIYIANPNQPSGNLIDYNKLSLIIKKAKKFNKYLIIDEAYIDFTSQKSATSLVKKNKNLIVLKTFSKSPGIAGLRFSYMITNPKLNLIINSIKPPYDVSQFSIKCAEFLLKNNTYFKNYLKEIKKIRFFIKSEAKKRNLHVKDTCANFFYISIKRSKIKNLIKKLFVKKILVKYNDFGKYKDFIRVSYGSKKQMTHLFNIIERNI